MDDNHINNIENTLKKIIFFENVMYILPFGCLVTYINSMVESLPFITNCDLCIIDPTKPSPMTVTSKYLGKIILEKSFTLDNFHKLTEKLVTKNINVYPIFVADAFYGFLAIEVSHRNQLIYLEHISGNLVFALSVILENIDTKNILENNRRILERHESELEKIISERTESLLQAKKDVEHMFTKTIEAIALTTEQHDPFTAGHQYRVAVLAQNIAQRLGISEKDALSIYLGGLIHDIGKIQVPAEILTTPLKLTNLQFDLIKTHPRIGYKIVTSIPLSADIEDIVLHHHERLNGSGYPDKLNGSEIPFYTKIISVADVFEAMSSHRPYRPAHTIDETINELTKNAGILYEPKVVEACVKLFKEENFVLPHGLK